MWGLFGAARASKVEPGVTKWAAGHSQAALCQMAPRSGWLAARGAAGGCRKQSTHGWRMRSEHVNNGAQTRPREWSAARKHSHMHGESHTHGEKASKHLEAVQPDDAPARPTNRLSVCTAASGCAGRLPLHSY